MSEHVLNNVLTSLEEHRLQHANGTVTWYIAHLHITLLMSRHITSERRVSVSSRSVAAIPIYDKLGHEPAELCIALLPMSCPAAAAAFAGW